MENLLPSQLCTICHAAPPKYRCPRCSTRTCSLPCTRRHKKWAQCSGVRDPTRYFKRAELATPQAFDHDFNFLTSIERSLDRAERDAEHRGIDMQEETIGNDKSWREQGLSGPRKGETQTKRALEECMVVIQRAPPGMARAKLNRTGWHKKRRTLVWTVEWILDQGTSQIGTCAANIPVAEAYSAQFPDSAPSKKKRQVWSPPKSLSSGPTTLIVPARTMASSDTTAALLPAPIFSSTLSLVASSISNPNDTPPVASSPPCKDSAPSPPQALHFYLLHPGTPSPTRVLNPLPASSTLAISLRNRVVLEFPTICVLHHPPDKLPAGFLTEEEYFRRTVPLNLGHLESISLDDSGLPERDDQNSNVSEGFDAERVLGVLNRDLRLGESSGIDGSNPFG